MLDTGEARQEELTGSFPNVRFSFYSNFTPEQGSDMPSLLSTLRLSLFLSSFSSPNFSSFLLLFSCSLFFFSSFPLFHFRIFLCSLLSCPLIIASFYYHVLLFSSHSIILLSYYIVLVLLFFPSFVLIILLPCHHILLLSSSYSPYLILIIVFCHHLLRASPEQSYCN